MSDGYGERSPERVRARELSQRTAKDAAEQVEQDSADAPGQPSDADAGEDVKGLAPDEPFDAAAYADEIRDRARRRVRPNVLNPNDPIAQALIGGPLGEQGLDTLRAKHARVWRLLGRPIGQRFADPR
ncbi:hypothetical protein ACWFNS_04750 [Oerskovia enterophila]